MKTAFLSFSLTDSTLSEYYIAIANELAKTHRVVVIADKIEEHLPLAAKIIVYKWPSRRPGNFRDFWFLAKKVIRYKPDVMLSVFGSVNIFSIIGFLFFVRRRIAWSRTVSSAFNDNRRLMRRRTWIYKLSTEVFANSDATKSDLTDNFAVDPKKIQVFPNALRKPQIVKIRNPKKIVYVGRLHKAKGVDTLFSAMQTVVNVFTDVKLVLIGGHLGFGTIARYESQAEALGISGNVTFLGTKPREAVFEELAGSAVTVFPSFAEGFGWVIIESFSVGTPVIGSDSTSIKEIIRDGTDGYLFNPGDSGDLAAKLVKLLSDADLQREFSANCIERFESEYEIEKVVKRVADYLAR